MTKQRTWKGAVFIAASVDGYIALPDGDLAWLTDPPPEPRHVPAWSGEDAPQGYEDFTAGVSHLVMGRGTYGQGAHLRLLALREVPRARPEHNPDRGCRPKDHRRPLHHPGTGVAHP